MAGAWDSEIRPAMVKLRLQLESTAVRALINEKGHDLRPFKINLRHFLIACEDNDLPSVVQFDMAFHRLILRQCGHAGLETVWLPIMAGMRLPYSRHKSLLESYQEHKSIVAAIEEGRIRKALEALKTNIR